MAQLGVSALCNNCAGGFRKEHRKRQQRKVTRRDIKAQRKKQRRPSLASSRRDEVFERDGHVCRFCGDTQFLQAHHIKYRSEGGPDDANNLIVLCDRHHRLVHSSKRTWQPILLELMRQHYECGNYFTVLQMRRLIDSESDPE